MNTLVLFTVTSTFVTRSDTGASGNYFYEELIEEPMFVLCPDKPGLVKRLIAEAVAGCCQHTGMPSGESIWRVSLNPRVAEATHLPKEMKL